MLGSMNAAIPPQYLPQGLADKKADALADSGHPILATALHTLPTAAALISGSPLMRGAGLAEAAPVAAGVIEREALLARVGLPEARVSALQGDKGAAANDFQEAKLDNPNGRRMKQVIDSERQTLSDHADSIVEGTGGTPGSAFDESTRTERGNNILQPLEDPKTHFDTQTRSLYNQADAKAGGIR